MLKLIEHVEKYPCLYDHTLKEYCMENVKSKVWNEVSKAIGLPGNELMTILYNSVILFGL